MSFHQLRWVFNSKTHGFVPLLGKNLPKPWVFSLIYWVFLEFWGFLPWVFSKCPISKPVLTSPYFTMQPCKAMRNSARKMCLLMCFIWSKSQLCFCIDVDRRSFTCTFPACTIWFVKEAWLVNEYDYVWDQWKDSKSGAF